MRSIAWIIYWFAVLAYGEHTRWHGDYDRALQRAKAEQKPLVVLLVKKECPRCRNIIRDCFANQPYVAALNAKSVTVIVTYEGHSSYPVELFYSRKFPTLFVVDSATESFIGEPVYSVDGNCKHIEEKLKGMQWEH